MLRATMTLALSSALVSAAPAAAVVAPVALAPHAAVTAVAGDHVLIAVNTGYEARLLSALAAGGAISTPLTRHGDASHPARWKGLAARGGRIAAEIATQDLDSEAPPLRTEVLVAPDPVAPAFTTLFTREKGDALGAPYDPLIDGDTTLIAGEVDASRHTLIASRDGTPPQPIALPPGALPAAVAGGHLAVLAPAVDAPATADLGRILVLDWRTGAQERSIPLPGDAIVFAPGIDIRADGAVAWDAIADGGDDLHVALPGQPERVLLAPPGDGGGLEPRFAGDQIAWIQYDGDGRRRVVALPATGGTPHQVGPTARAVAHLSGDGERLAWMADDCAVSALVTDGALAGLPAGPCPRTLAEAPDAQTADVPRAPASVAVVVRCVAAPDARCAGEVTLSGRSGPVGRARFTGVPVGAQRRVTVALTTSGRARVRRALTRHPTAGLLVRVAGIDPQGRRSRSSRGNLLLMRRGARLRTHIRRTSEVPSDVRSRRASTRYAG